MHKLESLELVGFKSFCDKTSVIFNDRITSIVGPNGCGKSNVAEAISWVLGEQRPKSLRGEKMEDVIFNGTSARKPLGFAEVTLALKPIEEATLDDGIPVDPIVVTRRLYRSGESEYLINDRRCRLLDIHQTFEGTGLGFTSYAIIEQGRIGSILTSKPMERRSLIEEAAKITTFKQKKKAAEIKLELAHQNLLRVNDIIVEIERQLRSLKRQATRAQAFSRLREEMRAFQRAKLHRDCQRLRSDLEQCQLQLQAMQAREHNVTQALQTREQSLQQMSLRHNQSVRDLEQRQEQLSLVALELERNLQTQDSQQRQIHLTRAQTEVLEQDVSEWERRLLEIRAQFQAKGSLRSNLGEELATIRDRIDQLKAENREVQKQIDHLEERLDQVRNYTLEEVSQKATLNNRKTQIKEVLSSLEAQQARITADRERLGGRCDQLGSAEARVLDQCHKIQEEIERLAQQQLQAEQVLTGVANQEIATAEQLQLLRERYSNCQHRLASIEEIEVRRTNYSEGVQKFLNFIQQRNSLRSSGTLADHVEADPQYEALVETFLDHQLEFVLVDGTSDALNGLEQLRESRAGKCTFLTLHTDNGLGSNGNECPEPDVERGIIGTLGTLLKMEEPVKQAFYRALPQYANAVVVQDIQHAQSLGHVYPETIFLTLAGETWTERGVISGVSESSHTSGLLALKREKRELVSRIAALQRQIQETEVELLQLKDKRKQMEQMEKDQRNLIHSQEKQLLSAQHEYNQILVDLQREEQATRVFNNELAEIQCERERLQAESMRIDQELQLLAQAKLDREQEFVQIQEILAGLRARSQEMARLLSENQSDLAANLERKHSADQEWTRLTEEGAQLNGQLVRHKEQLSTAEQRITSLEGSNRELAALAERLQARRQQLETELNQKKAAIVEVEKELRDSQQALEEEHRVKEAVLEQRMQLEVTRARLDNDQDHMRQYCVDELDISVEQLTAAPTREWEERPDEEIKAEYEQLKRKVEDFGPINMSALEEYQANEERFDFLTRQRGDIERSMVDTQRAIQEINKRSCEQFLEAFKAIDLHFKDLFRVLFGGGECGMLLLDEQDALESGIDIYAQPPGKKLQNIMLLSGGEKALIAFALLIAIFKYRPSPFCVLDEVDAPLDEANIARFTNLVQSMSDVTQFIIITHNKRTIETSQRIYGITMEQPGVSKVVSVSFN
ncbi:MAG: chromosome segregation protein SMC [Acidobacteria bacterium]|nr:chromosome segregation protein SMC [Acidobacteriota bacterium]